MLSRLRNGSRALRVALELLVALNALVAGAAFVIAPDGRALGMSTQLLASTPFATYRVPGLVLLVAVGGSLTTAAALELSGHRRARAASLAAATITIGWIVGQLVLLGYISVLQPVIVAMGLVIAVLSRVDSARST